MSHYRDLMAQPPDIATRAELLQRLSALARPAPERAPAPSSEKRLETFRQNAVSNEDRIADLNRTLNSADRAFNRDYSRASLKGRARADFGYSR